MCLAPLPYKRTAHVSHRLRMALSGCQGYARWDKKCNLACSCTGFVRVQLQQKACSEHSSECLICAARPAGGKRTVCWTSAAAASYRAPRTASANADLLSARLSALCATHCAKRDHRALSKLIMHPTLPGRADDAAPATCIHVCVLRAL